MKKLAVTFGMLLLVGLLTACASGDRGDWSGWSGGSGSGLQDIRWNDDLNEVQAAELNSLEQKFCNDSVKLRKKIRANSEELINTLLNTSEPDSRKVKALQTELSEFSASMTGHIVNLELEALKIAPDSNYVRRAYIRNYNWICERPVWSIQWVSAQAPQ
jgi:hypothetical protein